jgi:hypothetical protein
MRQELNITAVRWFALSTRSHRGRFEQRPNVGASLAASLADEPRFQIGQPDVIGPLVGADRDRMAAAIVRAIDQDAAHA